MISVDQAWRDLEGILSLSPACRVPLASAHGRVLRKAIRADRDAPPFDRVMMDGFAFSSSADPEQGFLMQASIPAGTVPPELLSPDHCIEVMTGGLLPPGCDLVVPVEDIAKGRGELRIASASVTWKAGTFVHHRASDVHRGEEVLSAGTRLTAPRLAVAATEGAGELCVNLPPRIHLISTGDEVVPLESEVLPHQIRASHAVALEALLGSWGQVTWRSVHAPDDPEAIAKEIASGLERADVLLLTGGVSMGKWDLVPDLLTAAGVAPLFHRIAQKPGKPLWVGKKNETLVFGLPGNPISALLCARRYLWPALDAAAGAKVTPVPRRPILDELRPFPRFTRFVPVVEEAEGLRLLAIQNSGHLHGLAGSDGFVECSPGEQTLLPGTRLPFFSWTR